MSGVTRVRLILLLSSLLALRAVAVAERSPALVALNEGRADDAIRALRAQLLIAPKDPIAHQLLCRTYYSIEVEDEAIHECEAATANAPAASENYLWLGRAYGLKASRTNPISAFRLARKVAAAFQRAVALDPTNVAALSDLGEYYVAAPAIVGGGLDKAQQLTVQMMSVSPTKAHRILALIAEKKDDSATAEAEFKKAVEAQPSAGTNVDLAAFYQRQKKNDECLAVIQTVVRLDHAKDAALVDAASILADANLSPQLARQLLSSYLASSAKTDGAPAPRVHLQLGNLLLKANDEAGARREFQAAMALAPMYAPAQKALNSLHASQAPSPEAIR